MHEKGFITNATGDPYKVAPPPGLRIFAKDGFLKGGHELNWKYARQCTHTRANSLASFEYLVKEPIKRKNYRDADGEVEIAPKGFLTRPLLKGRTASTIVIHRDGHFEH